MPSPSALSSAQLTDSIDTTSASAHLYRLKAFLTGLLLPLSFAPFHLPGCAILGMALLFTQIQHKNLKQASWVGFFLSLGFFGSGVSWVYISIHEYGHLNEFLSACITLLFILYLSLFMTLVLATYPVLALHKKRWVCPFIFSALWCLGEWLRATVLGGFPWLTLGFGQIDSPLQQWLPLIGVYGTSFLTVLLGCYLALAIQQKALQGSISLAIFVLFLMIPQSIQNYSWSKLETKPISIAVIQANLSMRDKWDESLFWQILNHYHKQTTALIKTKDLVIMPESAFPLPPHYIADVLDSLDEDALRKRSAVVLGIPYSVNEDDTNYYNALLSLGDAEGHYFKQHLVIFGEFVPHLFTPIMKKLGIALPETIAGSSNQPLIQIHHHPIASLICYELAYPELLRRQLPEAQWIISVSDIGWFGHSLAIYQHLQMAQVLSKLTGRYHIVANNDGLSAVIDDHGVIVDKLPAFHAGILQSSIFSASGSTPWLITGDLPIKIWIGMILFLAAIHRKKRS